MLTQLCSILKERGRCAISVSYGKKLPLLTINQATAFTTRSNQRLHLHFGTLGSRKAVPEYNYRVTRFNIRNQVRSPILIVEEVSSFTSSKFDYKRKVVHFYQLETCSVSLPRQ